MFFRVLIFALHKTWLKKNKMQFHDIECDISHATLSSFLTFKSLNMCNDTRRRLCSFSFVYVRMSPRLKKREQQWTAFPTNGAVSWVTDLLTYWLTDWLSWLRRVLGWAGLGWVVGLVCFGFFCFFLFFFVGLCQTLNGEGWRRRKNKIYSIYHLNMCCR